MTKIICTQLQKGTGIFKLIVHCIRTIFRDKMTLSETKTNNFICAQ